MNFHPLDLRECLLVQMAGTYWFYGMKSVDIMVVHGWGWGLKDIDIDLSGCRSLRQDLLLALQRQKGQQKVLWNHVERSSAIFGGEWYTVILNIYVSTEGRALMTSTRNGRKLYRPRPLMSSYSLLNAMPRILAAWRQPSSWIRRWSIRAWCGFCRPSSSNIETTLRTKDGCTAEVGCWKTGYSCVYPNTSKWLIFYMHRVRALIHNPEYLFRHWERVAHPGDVDVNNHNRKVSSFHRWRHADEKFVIHRSPLQSRATHIWRNSVPAAPALAPEFHFLHTQILQCIALQTEAASTHEKPSTLKVDSDLNRVGNRDRSESTFDSSERITHILRYIRNYQLITLPLAGWTGFNAKGTLGTFDGNDRFRRLGLGKAGRTIRFSLYDTILRGRENKHQITQKSITSFRRTFARIWLRPERPGKRSHSMRWLFAIEFGKACTCREVMM